MSAAPIGTSAMEAQDDPSTPVDVTVVTEPPGLAGTFDIAYQPGTSGPFDVVASVEAGTTHRFEAHTDLPLHHVVLQDPGPAWRFLDATCDPHAGVTTLPRAALVRTSIGGGDPPVTCMFTVGSVPVLVIGVATDDPDAETVLEFEMPGANASVAANDEVTLPAPIAAEDSGITIPVELLGPLVGWELTGIVCEETDPTTPSRGDVPTATASYGIDPNEIVSCKFQLEKIPPGALVVEVVTDGPDAAADIEFDVDGRFEVVAPGDPFVLEGFFESGTTVPVKLLGPPVGWELTGVACEERDPTTPSHGDVANAMATYGMDPGEAVTCRFLLSGPASSERHVPGAGDDAGSDDAEAVNPFDEPDAAMASLPLPDADRLPPDAGTHAAPESGRWRIRNVSSSADCPVLRGRVNDIPPATGVLQVRRGGQRLVGSGFAEGERGQVAVDADPAIIGRYKGSRRSRFQGGRATARFTWQVITPTHMVRTTTITAQVRGQTCEITREYDMRKR